MATRKGSYTYNPQTGTWNRSSGNSTTSTTKKPASNNKSGGSSSKKSGDNLTSSSTGKKSSGGKTEKKANYIEFNTLSGTLNYIVNEKTIKIKAGDTIKLAGLGKYLSGKYYVKDVTRQISSSGYSNSATLIKTDMGTSLKKKKKTKKKNKLVATKSRAAEFVAEKESTFKDSVEILRKQRVHVVKKGENLWNISKRYYGDTSLSSRISLENGIDDTTVLKVGQTLIIP